MAKLVINPTSASKKEIPIVARVISIGRDPSNDLVLSDSMVSRRHAILEHREDRYVLRDNNSSNGTLVNGDRVSDEQTLRDGDLVAIGSARLLFRLDDGADGSLSDLSLGASSDGGDGSSAPGSIGFERRCPSCGKVTLPEDRFCRGCGAGLGAGSARTACPSCGKEVLLPADFCGSCGKPLQASMAADLSTRPHRVEELVPPSSTPSEPSKEAKPSSGGVAPARRPPKPSRATEENAPFGLRLVAALVDLLVLGIPVLVIGLVWATLSVDATGAPRSGSPSLLAAGVLGLGLFAFFYFFLFWGFRGATPGASLLGLVVRTDGGVTPIGPVRAAIRTLSGALALLPLGLGLLWVALSRERLGWHDRLSGTRVKRST